MHLPRLLPILPQMSVLAVLLLGTLASAYLAVQLALRQEHAAAPLRPGEADFYATGVHLLRYDRDGQVSVQMRAERLEHIPSEGGLALVAPVLWMRAANGDTTHAASQRGVASDDARSARLEGDVRLVRRTVDGETMEIHSERALLESGGAVVRMPGRVRIAQAGIRLEGTDLLADDARKTLSLGPRVYAHLPGGSRPVPAPRTP